MDDKLNQSAKKQLLERARVMPEGMITQCRGKIITSLYSTPVTLLPDNHAHIWISQLEKDVENLGVDSDVS